jgi:hypothetical protein
MTKMQTNFGGTQLKVGLYNLEPQIVNTAMMQVSTYYKERGSKVEIFNHLEREEYDMIYAFSIFDFTDKRYVTPDMIAGGTGFDVTSRLNPAIEACSYDYSIFPKCDFSVVWFSRGCIRKCPFCVVPRKEGKIHSVEPKLPLNPKGKYIRVRDNNFFANPRWHEAVETLNSWGQPIDLEQGVDVRIMDDEQYEALKSMKLKKLVRVAWDNPKLDLRDKLAALVEHVNPEHRRDKIQCYVLIGFDSTPEEDLYRVRELIKLSIDPYVMPFDLKDPWQRKLKGWVNRKSIFNSGVTWEDYCSKNRPRRRIKKHKNDTTLTEVDDGIQQQRAAKAPREPEIRVLHDAQSGQEVEGSSTDHLGQI